MNVFVIFSIAIFVLTVILFCMAVPRLLKLKNSNRQFLPFQFMRRLNGDVALRTAVRYAEPFNMIAIINEKR